MNIVWIILGIFAVLVWAAINIFTIKMMSAKQMRDEFIEGQCLVGKICANIFYAPAWFFKGLRFVVLCAIK